ncbi:isocitrate lyase/PEP mutase family protein [Flagellimonas sp.]|uniref:isocitrate lyase/PEP mutase family protein n=1 Tax=Flagellimonas sp. TaxID=2058762 RepID=UPI003B5ACA9B
MTFYDLHQQEEPLLIFNVWDVPSAKLAQQLNFGALGTSSSAIASMLGYRDGEEMGFDELEYIVERIISNTDLPLSVDLESGYSREPEEITGHIRRLANLGVVGINIEDSVVSKERTLLDADEFAQTLSKITEELAKNQTEVFINVRTDTFLLNQPNALVETQKRAKLYESAGANGIFVPCMESESDIEQIVNCTTLPLNVMCMPKLPDFAILKKLGVKRISMGNFLFPKMSDALKSITEKVLDQKSFKPVF